MSVPANLKVAKSHEYVLEENGVYKIGITDHAVHQLGDIVFVEFPETDVEFEKGEVFGTVESVKAASELYMPISGKVVETNEALMDEPELVNADNYGKGWFMKIEAANTSELSELMNYDEYQKDLG